MQGKLCQLCNKFQILMLREEGQDLIEYALLVAVIAFATTAGMQGMAGGVNTVFTTLGTTFITATG
jgi:pilus assembly protein Flp/PilA